jgi:peptidoglycan-N-acetylglucosamine deacetylase
MYIILFILLPLFLAAMIYASYSIQLGVYVKCLCKSKHAGKVLALTFDDGVDPVTTPLVLDVLKKYGVPATFFIIGSKAEKYPELVKRIVAEGHEIGNHSYSHQGMFPLLSNRAMVDDLQKGERILHKLSGKEIIYFRPPFGVTNPTIAKAVSTMGYTTIGWSIRSLDTLNKEREWVRKRVLKRLHNGGVILLHDNRPAADLLLEMILKGIAQKGYKIIGINELFKKK